MSEIKFWDKILGHVFLKFSNTSVNNLLGEGEIVICCTSSWENYVRLVSWQNNDNNPKF